MSSLGTVIGRGLLADRPTANIEIGSLYFVTDESTLYRWSGSAWESVEADVGTAHDPVTVSDSASIDLALTGQALTADVIADGHTQSAATITDLAETVQDLIGAALVAGTNVTVAYDDATGQITISATGTGGGLTDPTTTQGDLLVRDASAVTRLGVGTDGQVLTVDGAAPVGLSWQPAATGGGSGSALLIAEQTLTAAAGTITFAAIPQTYRSLRLELLGRGNAAGQDYEDVVLTLNGDTGANYDHQQLTYGTGSTSAVRFNVTDPLVGWVTGPSSPANTPGSIILDIPDYTGTIWYKTWLGRSALRQSLQIQLNLNAGWWHNTAAITSIAVSGKVGQFVAGTVARLYGLV